jgi:hypothetical protein
MSDKVLDFSCGSIVRRPGAQCHEGDVTETEDSRRADEHVKGYDDHEVDEGETELDLDALAQGAVDDGDEVDEKKQAHQ